MLNYRHRFYLVINYIDSHLDDELSIEQLSGVASLSKYHFHRQFSAIFGLNVAAYIKQLRLKRAAFQLAYRRATKVIDIALCSGYESAEAFSRAFKQHSGQSPSEFRENPQWNPWRQSYQSLDRLRNFSMDNEIRELVVKIVEFDETKVAVLAHRGPAERLGDSIRQFIQWRTENNLPPRISRTFNLVYDDPARTEPENYRFDLCASIKSTVPDNALRVVASAIPAGRCAVVRHIGADDHIDAIVNYLYSTWLDDSGEQLRDFPLFFERVNLFPDVPEHAMITDIYLPLIG